MKALLFLLVAALAAVASALTPADLLSRAQALQSWMVEQRRELHKVPEPGFKEFKTHSRIVRFLESHNIPYRFPYAKTGIVAEIGSGKPVVAIRTDMDALPIHEPEGAAFRSQHEGWMHACGHDGHMTMAMGAAKLLWEAHQAGELPPGSVYIVFQPAEEGGAGGDIMIQEGALEDVDAIFGMHVMPHLPAGSVHTRPGTIMAGALSFRVTVAGRGGHAAMPHLNVDPVVAAAGLVSALQVPCALTFLGIRNETAGSVHALHSPKFTLDEGVLYKGAAMHASVAVNYLRTYAVPGGQAAAAATPAQEPAEAEADEEEEAEAEEVEAEAERKDEL
ncbi:hypothetical protein GPECTOR_6g511 [Gonium pectorale]|uniref:Peptidase M20 dimerisation domain-containing protein n=1 Tax=Gonium pectorale TaxID=33097 RepID=A0A150GUX0_GONPE|nr:hypothetical protein GPECTOR_6g511 [Gonium pectorale]|eukprot:KXZ53594.1 hypothetical protein GPECTOR_6g511 [Gonium pectorale]